MSIEKCRTMIAELERKREKCATRGRELLSERSSIALEAHTTNNGPASKRLMEINAALALHASEIESLDVAIEAAGKKLTTAEHAAAAAVNRQKAAEAQKHVDELAEVFEYTDKHLLAALKGLIAIEHGVTELHQKGVAFPTDVQLRLGITAVLGTFLQQLPRTWWNEISAGLRFRAPAERKTALSYWEQLEPALRQRLRAGEQVKEEKAA